MSNRAQSRHLKPRPMQNTTWGVLVPLNKVQITQLEISHVSERLNMMDMLAFTKSLRNTSLHRFSLQFLTTHYLQVFTCPNGSFKTFYNLWEIQMDKDDGLNYIF